MPLERTSSNSNEKTDGASLEMRFNKDSHHHLGGTREIAQSDRKDRKRESSRERERGP